MSLPAVEPAATTASTGAAATGVYAAQARGDADAYAAYYAGMDKSMQQKVALTTAYFPVHGVLADMGSGSGAGSFDLANLHRGLHVIGVDVAPESVSYAQQRYQRPNLEFRLGDIAEPIFAPDSLDGVLNSSVWHHLTSFNGFSLEPVRRSLRSQTAALRTGGVLIVRDFVVPRGPEQVLLDLPTRDGQPEGAVQTLSTAALFERFAQAFRSSQNLDGPVPFVRLGIVRPGWMRYRLSLRAATEFVLHKDYRDHWDAECREEYTFFRQADYEQALADSGLRVVVSVELRNPWIVQNRFRGHFFLYDLSGRPLPVPPTNYLIVGEKVASGQGVRFAVQRAPELPPQFLQKSTYQNQETGQQYELVERPNPTIDLVPWFRLGSTAAAGQASDAQVFILGKQGFPRPLLGAETGSPNLDGSNFAGYLTEPISAMSADIDGSLATVQQVLARRAGLLPGRIIGVKDSLRYFTSPGGLNERVTARLVELQVDGSHDSETTLRSFTMEIANYSQFSGSGRVRPLLATQLLRAAQVGGLLDARLEMNTYQLLLQLGVALGPWIGVELALTPQKAPPGAVVALPVTEVLQPPSRAVFAPAPSLNQPGFLDLHTVRITEHAADGLTLSSAHLELVVPRPTSCSTLSILPMVFCDGQVLVGLETRDLPAAQVFTGQSSLVSNPAFRLPQTVQSLDQADAQLSYHLLHLFGARTLQSWPLGGKYYPAAGVTPEVVYPVAVQVDVQTIRDSSLQFVALTELVAHRHLISDGHLLVLLFRLAHALGVIS